MTDNPFTEAADDVEAQEQAANSSTSDDFDADQYLEALNSEAALKEKTIGIAVTEEMHAFYHELQDADDVDADPTQSIRDHLEKLAHRHPQVFEKAMRKLEIEREFCPRRSPALARWANHTERHHAQRQGVALQGQYSRLPPRQRQHWRPAHAGLTTRDGTTGSVETLREWQVGRAEYRARIGHQFGARA